MSLIVKNINVIAYANGFTLWNYLTDDTLENIRNEENYFRETSPFVRAGDLIIVVSEGQENTSSAILAVSKVEKGAVSVKSLTA